MTIYIAGPMSGHEEYNLPAFYNAEKKLVKLGHKVLNPAKIGILPKYEMYYPINCAMLDGSDAIYMLDGWQRSKGACKEFNYAKQLGLTVLYPKDTIKKG